MPQQAIGLQLRSTVKKEGILELSLTSVPIPEPKPDEVVVRVDASPINPSDVGLMFGGADLSTAKASGTPDNPVVTASIPPAMMRAMAGRVDQSLPAGNEGAGVVVRAGSSDRSPGADGQDRGDSRRRHVRAVPLHQGQPVPRLAAGHHAGGGRLLLREPAHRTRHGRDHACGRPFRARAHGGGLEPGPDAEQDLHQGRHRTGEYRAQTGARGPSARPSAPNTW